MQILSTWMLLASAALGALAAEELKIDVTVPVECDRKTQSGDKVQMHYRGTLAADGKQFDAKWAPWLITSYDWIPEMLTIALPGYDRGTPFSFKLGSGQVIKGWDEGLLDMCIGEKRTLTIPPEKGYGQRGMGPIPAGSTLIFETELLGIDGVPKPESIILKTSTSSEAPAETAKNFGEKVAEKFAEATEAAKTMLRDTMKDTDDAEHVEL
ncbi:hypothetical protein J7T55_008100 [Diaporthe amygdali]|uniref:uncharacterized protein n=1 Tax=Phomopsis amygdali TaxID=1214568 RepID=UPI0022FE593E|nr:uncharacterized protein J7T55_008100 [Diaporthe amygdali]KAJ0107965.1 hypothetical protein J7T55_008100 [Diaporthe amygdali]